MLHGGKAELFKALGHPVRIRILELLRDGEHSVSGLHAELGVEMSSVSQQLAILRGRGLVAGQREGTTVIYRVIDDRVYHLLDTAGSMVDRHSDPGRDYVPGRMQETARVGKGTPR